MELNDASRIIDVIDQRIRRLTQSESRVETTWGTVAALDATGRYADLYLYGQSSPYASAYFRLPNGLSVNVGDSVKAAIDKERDDRWVEEVHAFPAYNKVEFDVVNGVVRFGDGAAAADVNLYRGAANQLKTDDALYVVGALNADGLATFASGLALTGTLTIGGDANLYRGAANVLQTDDTFIAPIGKFGGTSGNAVYIGNDGILADVGIADTIGIIGQENSANGRLVFGSANDTNLYRYTANVLATDDDLMVAGSTILRGWDTGTALGMVDPTGTTSRFLRTRGLYVGGDYGHALPAAEGIAFGADVNLYRSAANTLKTDDDFRAAGTIISDSYVQAAGGALYVNNGILNLGYGSSWDTRLYRDSASSVRIDNGSGGAANLTVLGQLSGATGVLPYAIWVGNVTVSLSAASSGFTTVSFPAGRFTVAPYVFVTQESLQSGTGKLIAKVNSNVTTTSADIYFYTGDGTTVTASASIRVLAIQMTSGAAAG